MSKKDKQSDEIENVENLTRHKKFWKFWITIVAINIAIVVIIVRLFYIQVINADYYLERAKRQHQSKVELLPKRGNIYDRNGNLLASNIKSVSVAVDPTVLTKKDTIATLIEKNIGIDKQKVLDKINSAKGAFVWISRRVLPNKVEELRKIKDRGLIFIDEPIRYYNYSSVASQLLGCTNIDNHGISGVELKYDSTLRGQSGYMIMYKDAKGRLRPAINLPTIPPLDGYDLHLTIDIELQKIVEFELMQGVLNSQAISGTVIAMEPSTGEILASASYPNFNPNNSSSFISEAMRNRAITDAYEPGSTFKTITAAAALEEKIVKVTDLFNGFSGELKLGSVSIRDEHPLGIVPFSKAFENSSNIILSQVAMKLPDQQFYKYIRDFGFGLPTQVDIPGELSGKIPKFNAMKDIDKRFFGFGYGILVTPIQLANAYSAVANGGSLMKPYLVREITKENKTVKKVKPQIIRKVISENTAKTLNRLLCGVVTNGTGKRTNIAGLQVAGKTGTSQKLISGQYSKSHYFASFVGYFPANNPKICLLILIDRPQVNFYGGSVAAPIFKNIALRWASVSKEIIIAKDRNESAKSNKNNVYVPDLRGLSVDEAKNILNELNLKTHSKQELGLVVAQFPKAGTIVKKNTNIMLQVRTFDANTNAETNEKVPKLVGLPLRRAITLLHNAGIQTKVIGSGKVVSQQFEKNKKTNETVCILKCQ